MPCKQVQAALALTCGSTAGSHHLVVGEASHLHRLCSARHGSPMCVLCSHPHLRAQHLSCLPDGRAWWCTSILKRNHPWLQVVAPTGNTVFVWNAHSGVRMHTLTGHQGIITVLEGHPVEPRLAFTADVDGTICIWDVEAGTLLKRCNNACACLDFAVFTPFKKQD